MSESDGSESDRFIARSSSLSIVVRYVEKLPHWSPAVLISVSLAIIATRDLLTTSGVIYLAEQFEVYSLDGFLNVVTPLWNRQLQSFSTAGQAKLYLYTLLYSVAKASGSYKALQFLALGLPIVLGFLGTYWLARHTLRNYASEQERPDGVLILSLLAGYLYTVNPWVVMASRNLMLRFGYACFPILIFFLLRLWESDDARYAVYFGVTLAIVSGYRFIVLSGIFVGVLILCQFIDPENRSIRRQTKHLGGVLLAYGIFGFLSLAKFLPSVLHTRAAGSVAANQFTESMLQREPIAHIFTTKIYSWTAAGFNFVYRDQFHLLFLVVVIFSLLSLLYSRGRETRGVFYRVFPPVTIVSFILLSAAEMNIDSLLLQLPLSSFVGRLLRHARWNVLPILVVVPILVAYSGYEFYSRRPRIGHVTVLCLLLLASGSAWPMLTGDMNGYWNPTDPPQDYVEFNEETTESAIAQHSVWFPEITRTATWSEQSGVYPTTAPTGIFYLRTSDLPSYSTKNLYFFQYYRPVPSPPTTKQQNVYRGDFSRVYEPLNIKYLNVHYDGGWLPSERVNGYTNGYLRQQAAELQASPWATTAYDGKHFTSIRLQNQPEEVSVRRSTAVYGGLPVAGSIASTDISNQPALSFKTSGRPSSTINTSESIVFRGSNSGTLGTLGTPVRPARTIEPGEESGWKAQRVTSSGFRHDLTTRQIRWRWQYGFGAGVVTTDKEHSVQTPSDLRHEEPLRAWTFDGESDVNQWSNSTQPESQTVSRSEDALRVTLRESEYGWKTVESPRTPVSESGVYRITASVSGSNAHRVHAKVIERNASGERVATQRLTAIGDGDFDTRIEETYHPKNASTEYVQLQIWHGHNTTKSLPNRVELNDVRVYDVTEYAEPVDLQMQFSVDEAGNYRLFSRHFANERGGQIRVSIDGEPVTVNTEDELNEFVRENLTTRHLDAGEHTLTLRNVRGFNAVNRFTLVREGTYQRHRRQLDQRLRNRTVTHLLEAESDLYLNGATTHSVRNASNGRVAILNATGNATRTVETATAGQYRLAVRGEGNFTVRVDDRTREIARETPGYAYTEPIRIDRGTHEVELRPAGDRNATLDVVWFYSMPERTNISERTIADVFASDGRAAVVESFERVGPAKYRVRVNASEPHTLSFAEGYDPFWVAEVQTDSGTKQVEPTPLYGVINGFRVEQTGEYTVTIRYRLQRWFRYGAAISALTLVACIGYLFYDWRRQSKS